eukprot:symbB.v1.2.030453.t1/scaffold3395.1/size57732/5
MKSTMGPSGVAFALSAQLSSTPTTTSAREGAALLQTLAKRPESKDLWQLGSRSLMRGKNIFGRNRGKRLVGSNRFGTASMSRTLLARLRTRGPVAS